MPAGPLVTVSIREVGDSHTSWAEGMEVSLHETFLEKTHLIEYTDTGNGLRVPPGFAHQSREDVEALLLQAAFTEQKPASSRFPVSYQNIPPRIRSLAARALGGWKRRRMDRWAAFPRWPLDLSADFMSDLTGGDPSPFAGGPTPVLLTHDLDSAEGLQSLVTSFAGIEESVGAKSCSYIVPFAWPIDHGLLREIEARGHDLGIHGYDHSNRTAFLEPRKRRERLEAAVGLVKQYNMTGYRAPSLLRTRGLLRDLSEFYRYDSSIPTSGGLFPVPNNGCASARPFLVEGIAEIPLSMPRDGSLIFLGHSPDEILDIWIRCAGEISRSGGVVVLLTHCESRFSGNPTMLRIYESFLEFLASSDRYKWSSTAEVLMRASKKDFSHAKIAGDIRDKTQNTLCEEE